MEQNCPSTKGRKTDFHRETQDGSRSSSVVSWSTPGTPVSVGITHQSASSWAAVGGPRGASDSTLELATSAGLHWCQRGGHHGLDTTLGWQKASSQHGWTMHWSAWEEVASAARAMVSPMLRLSMWLRFLASP